MFTESRLMPMLQPLFYRFFLMMGIVSLFGANARADYRYGPLAFSAFGTLGGAWSSNDQADYTIGIQPTGPGRSYAFDLGMDSRLGGQLDLSLTDTTTLTAQAVFDRNADNEFLPRLTLGQLRQEFLDHFTLRAGRMQNPMFLTAEYRLANFANPWVRAPNVVYDMYPQVAVDGAELSYRLESAFGQINLRAGYGWFDFAVPIPRPATEDGYEVAKGKSRNLHYLAVQWERGSWRAKAGWVRGYTTFHEQSLDAGLEALRAFDSRAANRLTLDNTPGDLVTIGAAYDASDWLIMGEWASSNSTGSLANRHGGYLTVGYHFDRLMPQITLGYLASFSPDTHSANPVAQGILDQFYTGARQDQRTLAVGLNYAVTDSIMLRSQLDLIQPAHDSNGPYSMNRTPQYDFKRPDLYYLMSFSLDFVY